MINFVKYLDFRGEIKDSLNVSGVQKSQDCLLLVTDERNDIFVMQANAESEHFSHKATLQLSSEAIPKTDSKPPEIDLEDIALKDTGTTFYAVGSHALARKSVKDNRKYKENLERLATLNDDPARDQVLKFSYDTTVVDSTHHQGDTIRLKVESQSLKSVLEKDSVLGRFTQIASKENGVDIEAIAAAQDHLYFGFRGPVLRGNYVPVMVTTFDDLSTYELRYVVMGGRGIRGMTTVKGGFLLIAGPIGDGNLSYELYFWNGIDCVPGEKKSEKSEIRLLGEIPTPPDAKAEGITVLQETETDYEIVIVYDGQTRGQPTVFRADKNGSL